MKTPKLLLVMLSMTLLSQAAQAQDTSTPKEKKLAFAATVGYAEKLDTFNGSGSGFHLGINMYKANARRWSFDSQVSFNYTGESNTSSNLFTFLAMPGVRYYFTSQDKPTRFFMNLLGGFALEIDSGDDYIETLPDVGYSLGFFVQSKQFVYGVSVESPENLIFKLGITF